MTNIPDGSDLGKADATLGETTNSAGPTITPARLGEWLSFNRCERYFGFSVGDYEQSKYHDRSVFDEAFEPLDPLLVKTGEEFEGIVESSLEPLSSPIEISNIDDSKTGSDESQINTSSELSTNEDELADVIRDACKTAPEDTAPEVQLNTTDETIATAVAEPFLLTQVRVATTIGEWFVPGDSDLILVWPTETGAHVRIFDLKSTREEKTYHRIQTACYAAAVENLLSQTFLKTSNATPSHESEIPLDEYVTVDCGVITRETELDSLTTPLTPCDLPGFDDTDYKQDIRQLCASNGRLQSLWQQALTEFDYTIEDKCTSCPYNEACSVDAIQDASLRLLGLSEQARSILRQEGITTLHDLAQLCYPLEGEKNPDSATDPRRQHKDTYDKLASDHTVGPKLPDIVYEAQSVLSDLGESGINVNDGSDEWLPRTGYGMLPEDDPPPEFDIDKQRGSMIRAYLNVQYDHLRDRLIQISGYVTATESDTPPQTFTVINTANSTQQTPLDKAEVDLLETAISELQNSTRAISAGLSGDLSLPDNTGPMELLHFYTFTEQEIERVTNALIRHETPIVDAFQELWEQHHSTEQPIKTAVQPEVDDRKPLRSPTAGLLQIYDQLSVPYEDAKQYTEWTYSPNRTSAPDEVDLRDIFGHRLFNHQLDRGDPGDPVTPTVGSASKINAPGPQVYVQGKGKPYGPDTLFARLRNDASIPLGYLYAAVGTINGEWVEELKTSVENFDSLANEVAAFRYHHGDEQRHEIHREDVGELGKAFANTVAHIERSLDGRDVTQFEKKRPVELSFELPAQEPTFADALQDTLYMEHAASRQEKLNHYRKERTQRFLSGETIPLLIDDVRTLDDSGDIIVEGEIRLDVSDLENWKEVQRCIEYKGDDPTEASGGDWAVAYTGDVVEKFSSPENIEHATAIIIDDVSPDSPGADIRFKALNRGGSGEFTTGHYTPDTKTTSDNYKTPFTEDDWCFIEPTTDSLTLNRQLTALEQSEFNSLYNLFDGLLEGRLRQSDIEQPVCDQDKLDTVADWLKQNHRQETFPSEIQRSAITAAEHPLTVVQGPPGTGKTSGVLGPRIVARSLADDRGFGQTALLVTAPSNKAIAEVREATEEILDAYSKDNPTEANAVSLYRIGEPPTNSQSDWTTFIDYNDDKQFRNKHRDNLREALGVAHGGGLDDEISIVFSTPGRAWRLVKKLLPSNPPDDEVAQQSIWSSIIADEASMMTVPQLMLAGAFLHDDGDVLLSGDQRQLAPIHKQEWSDIQRRAIRTYVPYLSAIEYAQLHTGKTDMLPKEHRDSAVVPQHGEAAVRTIGLDQTYRFGPTTADFLREQVYREDDIEYTSGISQPDNIKLTGTASSSGESTPALADALGRSSVVLCLYDTERGHRKANDFEAAVVDELLDVVNPNIETGIVTPHSAQRGRIESQLAASGKDSRTTVDTVNRFQGGEMPLMILSGTVSDPDFVAAESDFLLDLNRLNVSLSRHENQLVIIAARALFEHIPTDVETYQQARLWKALARQTGVATDDDPLDTIHLSGKQLEIYTL